MVVAPLWIHQLLWLGQVDDDEAFQATDRQVRLDWVEGDDGRA